jgi:biotin carboxylase
MALADNVDKAIELAAKIHAEHPIDAVVTFLEFTQEATAAIAKKLNIATNIDEKAMALTRCKLNMRACFAASNLNTIPYARVDSLETLRTFFLNQAHPVIVKPAQGAASKGVNLVRYESELAAAFANSSDNNTAEVIVESFIDSPHEFSVESLSLDGHHEIIAYTAKTTQGESNFVEVGHVQPAQIDADLKQIISEQVVSLLYTIGHLNGPAHTELRVKNGIPYIIETQLRIGGDQIWEMTELTSGRSQISETLAHLVNIPAPAPTATFDAAAIRFVMPETIQIEQCPDISGYQADNLRLELETTADWQKKARATHSGERLGYCLATGSSVSEVLKKINTCFDTLKFH